MFSSAKSQINKMMAMLPGNDDLMSLDEYNKYYKQMLKNQVDASGNELAQKKEIEEQHRNIISNALQCKMKKLKNERSKK
jgi:hypothetical protein